MIFPCWIQKMQTLLSMKLGFVFTAGPRPSFSLLSPFSHCLYTETFKRGSSDGWGKIYIWKAPFDFLLNLWLVKRPKFLLVTFVAVKKYLMETT